MPTMDKEVQIRRKMKKNRAFKKRVQWYALGQRRCHFCGVQMVWSGDSLRSATVEHMVPASAGGTYHMQNILINCKSCNSRRSSEDWIDYVLENNLPKSEWLIDRYLKAVEFYRSKNTVIDFKIFASVDRYKKKTLKKAA